MRQPSPEPAFLRGVSASVPGMAGIPGARSGCRDANTRDHGSHETFAGLAATHLVELTIHQPQIDFERETPDRVKALVWEFAESLGFRDMSLTVLFSKDNAQCKANLAAFFEAGREVNAEAERKQGKS